MQLHHVVVGKVLQYRERTGKMFKTVSAHEPTIKGTSQGRKPITSTMNKNKRRSFKSYRGQGKN